MAIALVSSLTHVHVTGGAFSTTIDTTGATLLVASVAWYNPGNLGALSDNKGNTWTPLTNYGTTTVTSQRFYYALNPLAGLAHQFNWPGNSTYHVYHIHAFSGVTGFQTVVGAQIDAAVLTSPSVFPSGNGALIMAGMCGLSANSFSLTPSVFDSTAARGQAAGTNIQSVSAWSVQTTAASIAPVWSVLSAQQMNCSTAVFLPGEPAGSYAYTFLGWTG